VEKAFDEAGEDGGDHAESEHVESYGEEDEDSGGTTAFRRMGLEGDLRIKGFRGIDELGLGEEGIGLVCGRLGRILGWLGHVWGLGGVIEG